MKELNSAHKELSMVPGTEEEPTDPLAVVVRSFLSRKRSSGEVPKFCFGGNKAPEYHKFWKLSWYCSRKIWRMRLLLQIMLFYVHTPLSSEVYTALKWNGLFFSFLQRSHIEPRRFKVFPLPYPVQYIPAPQAPPTHWAQVYPWKFVLLLTPLGLLGFSGVLPGSYSSFMTQLSCHRLREASPDPHRSHPCLCCHPAELLLGRYHYRSLKAFYFVTF